MIKEVDLGPLIDELLKEYQRERSAPKPRHDGTMYSSKGKIYISTVVASDCDKQIRYMFEDVPKDEIEEPWPGLENEIGTLIHDTIQRAFMKKNGLAEVEKKISVEVEGVKINMKVDGVFHINSNVLEMKTLGSKDYDLQKPREKDYLQANLYMGILGVKTAFLVYLKRENGKHIRSFQVDFDQEKYDKLIARIGKIIRDEKLKYNKKSCKFCKFTKYCKEKGRPW